MAGPTSIYTSWSSISSATNHTIDMTTDSTTFDDKILSKINTVSMTVDATGMLCNTLLILVIIVDPLRILRKGAWITILNLSVADFLACFSHFVQVLLNHTEKYEEYQLTIKEFTFIWKFSVGASFMFLTLLTAQIYVVIKDPVKGRLALTTTRVTLACLEVWVLAFPLGLSEIASVWMRETLEVLYFYIANIAVLELVVVIQVTLKIMIIVKILRSRRRRIEELNAETQDKENIAKTIVILIVILFLTAFPFFVAKQISYLATLEYFGPDRHPMFDHFRYYYEPIGLLNYVANPILYSLRLQDYRRSMLSFLTWKCKTFQHTNGGIQQMTVLLAKHPASRSVESVPKETKV